MPSCGASSRLRKTASAGAGQRDEIDYHATHAIEEQDDPSHQKIDVAVLNVGDGPVFNMAQITAGEALNSMRVNYDTFVHFLIPVMEHMKPFREGMIVHTNSLAGFLGLPMPTALSEEQAAKHMIRAMEKGGADYVFPWVYKLLIKLAGLLPKRLVGRLLLFDLPEEY